MLGEESSSRDDESSSDARDEEDARDKQDARHEENARPEEEPAEPSGAARSEQQTLWVDAQLRQAMARGEFDDLPGAGKPIQGLSADAPYDPNWWAKQLIEREQLTGLAPPAIALRTEDAGLNDRLDHETSESEVRRIVGDFNARIVHARRQLLGGPPVVTPTRDPDAEVAAWRVRRDQRRAEQRRLLDEAASPGQPAAPPRGRRRLFRRRRPNSP